MNGTGFIRPWCNSKIYSTW